MKTKVDEFWAVVSSGGHILHQNKDKYRLLKLLIHEPVSKKNIGSFKSDDTVTIMKQRKHVDRGYTHYTEHPQICTLFKVKQITEFLKETK